MKKASKANKSVVFTRFFLTYLVILIIPFLVFSVLFFSIMGEMKANSIRESSYVLNSVKDEVDYKMELVYSSTLNLNYNTAINGLLKSPAKHRDIAQLLSARSGIGHLEKDSNTIYVYLPEDEILLSSRGVYSKLEDLYGEIFSYGDMDYEEFHDKILNGTSQKEFLPDTRVRTNSREYSAILYLVRIPFGFQSGASAKILFFIDTGQIGQQIEEYVQESKSWFGIYTKDGTLLYHTANCPGDLDLFLEQYEKKASANQKQQSVFDRNSIIYTTATSDFNGWLFVSGMAKKDLYAQVRKNQFTVVVIFFIYAVTGCYASYYISKRNLRPLHRLLAMWNNGGGQDGKHINEYQILESNFQDIISHNQELAESNIEYLEKMKESWMQNLICGRYNTLEEIEELELPEIAGFSHFQVVLIDLSAPSLVLEEQSFDDFNQQRYLIKSSIRQLNLKQAVIADISIEQLGILFCSEKPPEQFMSRMEEQRRVILHYLKESVGSSACLGYGEAVKGPLLIGYSYIQAKCAVRACLEYHKDCMGYASIPRKNEKYYFPDQLREMIFDAVKKGNLKQVKSILKVLQVENFDTRQLTSNQERQFLEEMYLIMLHLKNEDFISEEEIEPDRNMPGQDKFYYYVQKIFAACMQRTEQALSQKEKIKQELITFVDENYMDSNLCLAMAASHFQLTESYFSYLFKKNYGVNFSSYLEHKRIEQAKLFILENGHSMEEVARLVGYNSSHVFRRAFRKVTGCNPSDLLKPTKSNTP